LVSSVDQYTLKLLEYDELSFQVVVTAHTLVFTSTETALGAAGATPVVPEVAAAMLSPAAL